MLTVSSLDLLSGLDDCYCLMFAKVAEPTAPCQDAAHRMRVLTETEQKPYRNRHSNRCLRALMSGVKMVTETVDYLKVT